METTRKSYTTLESLENEIKYSLILSFLRNNKFCLKLVKSIIINPEFNNVLTKINDSDDFKRYFGTQKISFEMSVHNGYENRTEIQGKWDKCFGVSKTLGNLSTNLKNLKVENLSIISSQKSLNILFKGLFKDNPFGYPINFAYEISNDSCHILLDYDKPYSFIFIEINPILGNNYQNVLQNMVLKINFVKKQKIYKQKSFTEPIFVLLVEKISVKTISKVQMIEIFSHSNINLVFLEDIGVNLNDPLLNPLTGLSFLDSDDENFDTDERKIGPF
jgi:hypothetical protein